MLEEVGIGKRLKKFQKVARGWKTLQIGKVKVGKHFVTLRNLKPFVTFSNILKLLLT